MSNTSWGKKLTTKINALVEASSRESIQTLAKWIGFNRKHAAAFVPVLKDSLVQANQTEGLQLTRLTVLHEVLILNKDDPVKWQRLEELRLSLGETVLLPVLAQLQEPAREQVRTSFLKEWDDANSFSGPTLLNQIRKAVSNNNKSDSSSPSAGGKGATATAAPAASTPSPSKHVATSASSEAVSDQKVNEKQVDTDANTNEQQGGEASAPAAGSESQNKQEDDAAVERKVAASDPAAEAFATPVKAAPSTTSAVAATSTANATMTYDFEASGIPAAKVDPKTLLEPTRTIASLQIARDLRNDGSVQLASLLSNLPASIQQSCQEGEALTADKARDYAMRTADVLIDMDLEEQLQSVRMYRDIVKRQRAARRQLIRNLIASRCEFGADAAADAFDRADRARGKLLKRKQVLMDAMELEGLDCTQEEKNLYAEDATEFPPLQWHTDKKARTQSAQDEDATAA